MPGLKPNEWEKWDSENLGLQQKKAEENVNVLLNRLWRLGLDRNIHENYKNRLAKWKVTPTANVQKITTKIIFELQRDLAALEFFIFQGFGDSISRLDFNNENGIYLQVQTIMNESQLPTDLQPVFPKMVQDAIDAIESDGHRPPAQDMEDAQVHFANLAAQAID